MMIMPRSVPSSASPNVSGYSLLGLSAELRKFLPVKLETLSNQLLLTRAECLYAFLFPSEIPLNSKLTQAHGTDVLRHILELAEQHDWFPVDWEVFNKALTFYHESEYKKSDRLVKFLDFIPLRFYSLTDPFKHRPLELLHYLQSDDKSLIASSEVQRDIGISNDPKEMGSEATRKSVLKRLEHIAANPGDYPEPVQWLPGLVKWIRGCTGNPILDCHIDPDDSDGLFYEWQNHLEDIKLAWKSAQPLINVSQRLKSWYEADNTRLAKLADFMARGENGHRLNW